MGWCSTRWVAALAAAAACFAQNSITVTGLVTDKTDLPVPKVKVVVTSADTGVQQATETNESGYYTVPALPPGTYVVSAELAGFKPVTSRPVKVEAGGAGRRDLVLTPSDTRQVVEVTAEPPPLETDTSMVMSTLTEKEIDSLPMASRNSLDFALTLPGVTGDAGADEGGIFQDVPTAGAGLIIGGGRASSSAFLADGTNATSAGIGRATVTFSPDTIQEIQVITSTFSAKYGVSGGGIIQKVSKAGGNRLRGTLYWYHRNPLFHARSFGSPIEPQQRRHEFGLTLSGPVRIPKLYNGRNKTFFFVAVEPKRWFDAIHIYDRFPTLQERQGDFRNTYVSPGQRRNLLYQQVRCAPTESGCRFLYPIHRPSSTAQFPLFSINDPDPSKRGLVIPKQYLDPLVQQILEDVPMPNLPYDSQGMNYFGTRGVDGSSNRYNLKLDHNLSGNHRVSGRYTSVPNFADRYRVHKENLFFSYQSDLSLTRQFQFSDTYTISPQMVNEFRAAYTFSDYSRVPPGDLATRNYTTEKFGLPSVTGWGYPEFRSGFGTYGLQGGTLGQYIEHQYQIADDLTRIHGRHTLSMGTDLRLMMINAKSSGGGLRDLCCGLYNFAAAQTNSGNANTPGGTGGLQFASFLLGVPNAVNLRGQIIPYYYRWRVTGAYFQDDFKLRPNLTINLGVRWQYHSPRGEKFNRQATIDLDNPVEILNPSGDVRGITFNWMYSGFGRSRYLEPAHKRDFEPRFGFAWQPRWRRLQGRGFVVRGGYGISHSPTTGRGRDPVPDFGAASFTGYSYARWQNNNPPRLNQAVYPNYLLGLGRNIPVITADPNLLELPADGIICHACSTVRDSRIPAGALILFAKQNKSPYIQSWNLTTQTQVGGQFVLSLTYMGNKGTHLYSPLLGINNPDPDLYSQLLDEGGDPNELVEDPFGRVDNAGNPVLVSLVNLMRPMPTAGDINVAGLTNSDSIFHAGAVSLDRRYVKGFSMRFNYTWGKSIDTASDASLNNTSPFLWGTTRVQDANDLRANRSISLFDTRHRLNLTMIWDLPLGRGRRFLRESNRATRFLVSHWSLQALGSWYSGRPFAPFLGDANGVPGGASGAERVRADLVLGTPLINPRWSKQVANDVPYFNPEAFARPSYGHTGNAARTLDFARNPWKHTLNVSAFREFRPFENTNRYFQFRAEFFNVLNHATFETVAGSNVSQLFTGTPPVSRTGLPLGGPMPYLVDLGPANFPTGTRESIIAQFYSQNFGKLWRDRNGPGRVVQLALKVYF